MILSKFKINIDYLKYNINEINSKIICKLINKKIISNCEVDYNNFNLVLNIYNENNLFKNILFKINSFQKKALKNSYKSTYFYQIILTRIKYNSELYYYFKIKKIEKKKEIYLNITNQILKNKCKNLKKKWKLNHDIWINNNVLNIKNEFFYQINSLNMVNDYNFKLYSNLISNLKYNSKLKKHLKSNKKKLESQINNWFVIKWNHEKSILELIEKNEFLLKNNMKLEKIWQQNLNILKSQWDKTKKINNNFKEPTIF